jgi:hypothetical protein
MNESSEYLRDDSLEVLEKMFLADSKQLDD